MSTIVNMFLTRAEAEKWARKVESEIDRAVYVDTRQVKESARDILEKYRQEVTPKKKGAKWEDVRLKKLMRAGWTIKPINDVTVRDITAWRDAQTVSSASVRREMVLLSSVFNHAIKEWHMPIKNPISGVKLPPDSVPRSRRPTDAELGALRVHFKNNKMGLLMELAIETGMRLGEMCSLHLDHIHIDQGYVHLSQTKNGTSRDVPLSSAAKAVLAQLLAQAQELGCQRLIPFSGESAGVYWREACKKLGIENLHFHDLRHEATTRLAARLSHLELASVTGHKDLRMLQRYYNPTASELSKKLG